MQAPSAGYPLPVSVDPEADRLYRLAAWIGATSGDDALVSFVSVAVAFLFGTDPVSLWFRRSVRQERVRVDRIFERQRLAEGAAARLAEELPEGWPSPGKVPWTRSALAILGSAAQIAEATGGGTLGTRHVMTAYLFEHPEDHRSDLESWGVDWERGRDAFLYTVQRLYPEEAPRWAARFGPGAAPAEAPPAPRGPPLPGFSSDIAHGPDRLGVTAEVNALCALVADRQTRPPLSIGLFGDWGSGKSFFMDLMERRIAALASRAGEAEAAGGPAAYCARVVQIRFNAWHYMDANLWATLASKVFDDLAAELNRQTGGDEARVGALLTELASSQALLADAEARLQVVRSDHEEAACRSKAIAERERALRDQLARPPLDARSLAAALGSDEVRRRLRDAALPGLALPADAGLSDLQGALKEYRGLWNRLRRAYELLRADRGSRGALLILGAAAGGGLVLGALAGPLLDLSRTLSAAAATLAGAAAALRPWVRRISDGVAVLEGVQADASRRLDEERAQAAREHAVLQVELGALTQERKAAEEAAAAAQREKNRVQEEIGRIREGPRLDRFLADRASCQDYRRALGVVALIRQDFEKLSDLLAGRGAPDPGRPRIDRIVLYIDDLDRCPEERVVEVLQAVHLLLAFPLFVVVVAVDSRWLLHALRRHYRGVLTPAGRARAAAADRPWETTPQNYLEKIFQVPFTLRPMGRDAFGRLVAGLLPAPAGGSPPGPGREPAGALPPAPAAPRGSAAPPPAPAPSPPDLPEPEEPADVAPRALETTPHEVTFLQDLWPLLPSPRSAKRLTNTYRLLRATRREEELDGFVGTAEEPGDFTLPLLLLGVLCGFPNEAPRFFRTLLAAGRQTTWGEFVAGLGDTAEESGGEASEESEWARLVRTLRALPPRTRVAAPLERFRPWAEEVVRYSFQTGRMLPLFQGDGDRAPVG